MDSEVYRNICSLRENASNFMQQRQWSQNTANMTAIKVLDCPSPSLGLYWNEHAFHILQGRLKGESPRNRQELAWNAVINVMMKYIGIGSVC